MNWRNSAQTWERKYPPNIRWMRVVSSNLGIGRRSRHPFLSGLIPIGNKCIRLMNSVRMNLLKKCEGKSYSNLPASISSPSFIASNKYTRNSCASSCLPSWKRLFEPPSVGNTLTSPLGDIVELIFPPSESKAWILRNNERIIKMIFWPLLSILVEVDLDKLVMHWQKVGK